MTQVEEIRARTPIANISEILVICEAHKTLFVKQLTQLTQNSRSIKGKYVLYINAIMEVLTLIHQSACLIFEVTRDVATTIPGVDVNVLLASQIEAHQLN